MSRALLFFKALRQLGPTQVGLYAMYQLGVRTGYYRWVFRTTPRDENLSAFHLKLDLFRLPSGEELAATLGSEGQAELLKEADEIAAGQIRLFGGPPSPLHLIAPGPLRHWTEYEQRSELLWDRETSQDIKWIWEPGRWGWAYSLARAYYLSRDERYAAAFWAYAEEFLGANPPYMGPQWSSAQEVALRVMAFAFSMQIFAASSFTTPERIAQLKSAIIAHAQRIPPTLVYARAQNNNHLLSEAAGLYTAGCLLPEHPSAKRWRSLGWRWFHRGLVSQIAGDGTYAQHSTNYHRMMLQLALWMVQPASCHHQRFPEKSKRRLAAATHWLLALLDEDSGQVPNLGPNDGAYILPLTVCPFRDYRPVLQASATAFLGASCLPAGVWDEMSLWLGIRHPQSDPSKSTTLQPHSSHAYPVIRSPSTQSWGYLRVSRFTSRPGHADQLHFDLWWRGMNLAQDAGTYSYNAPPPWDNALARTEVHNTVVINDQDQMSRAGRFLFLDWAQAQVVDEIRSPEGRLLSLTAQHDGYHRIGVIHRRKVTVCRENRWIVEDLLKCSSPAYNTRVYTVCLHWLLPDLPHRLEIKERELRLELETHFGLICLRVAQEIDRQDRENTDADIFPTFQVIRAGETIAGSTPASPVWGWSSPTYGVKIPALSVRATVKYSLPVRWRSEWSFPET